MLKIGEMSKICKISIQTLRYYDKIGILCADFVDQDSGYRYYNPSKIQLYQKIVHLKDLGFSLEEIKLFLNSTPAKQTFMYAERKREIEEKIQQDRNRIKMIDHSCTDQEQRTLPLNQQSLEIAFEDDPAAVGKWSYCGDLPMGSPFKGEQMLEKKDFFLGTLFFLPGGGHVWTYFWSHGILYYTLTGANMIVPNEYRIFEYDGETYMTVNWMVDKCINEKAVDRILIYHKEDSCAYTEKDAYLYTDDVNLPFVADDFVLGRWEAFDIIESPDRFSIASGRRNKRSFYVRELHFFERGMCRKLSASHMNWLNYTAGYILNRADAVAEHYEARSIAGEDYLIVEHKSGDYRYLGKIFCYYVFRRKKDET